MAIQNAAQHSIESTNLADLLERVLDKGVVIAGDIKISLVDIELLTIQIRLVICSVDKAKEMGMDWWVNNPLYSKHSEQDRLTESLHSMEERMAKLESKFGAGLTPG
ncbi:MAG: gas vesicle protein [Desulfobacteraceae bacterium]|nr:gas vesicle protein [Desulfobacteraceae bacterium]